MFPPRMQMNSAPAIEAQSTLTCPHCGHQAVEVMPTDACQFSCECRGCGVVLKPLAGDCGVFCSYGSHPCPPLQLARSGAAFSGSCGQI